MLPSYLVLHLLEENTKYMYSWLLLLQVFLKGVMHYSYIIYALVFLAHNAPNTQPLYLLVFLRSIRLGAGKKHVSKGKKTK